MKYLTTIIICLMLQGCAIHYHNSKHLNGQGNDVQTPYGVIAGIEIDYKSTFDFWFPWQVKADSDVN